jgi:hypothetical protein
MFLEMLERQSKRRISKRALEELKHKFSAAGPEAPRSGDSRRFRVFPRRLCVLEVPRFFPEAPRCPETAAQTEEERVKTRSKQLGLT